MAGVIADASTRLVRGYVPTTEARATCNGACAHDGLKRLRARMITDPATSAIATHGWLPLVGVRHLVLVSWYSGS